MVNDRLSAFGRCAKKAECPLLGWLADEVIEHRAPLLGRVIGEALHRAGGYVANGAAVFGSGCVAKRNSSAALTVDNFANQELSTASSERSFVTAEQ